MNYLKKTKTVLALLILIASFPLFAQTETAITDKELSQFVSAAQEVQVVNEGAQQEMMALIQNEGMDLEKFNEIQTAAMDPTKKVSASEEEIAQHQKVMLKIEKMQPKFEQEMESLIIKNGLTLSRYQTVATALQTDTALQQRLQQLMGQTPQ